MGTGPWINRELFDANRADAMRETEAIAAFIAAESDTPLDLIVGKRRFKKFIRWRAAIAWLARSHVVVQPRVRGRRAQPISYPQIGEVLGGRDHSTVIGLVAAAETLRRSDREFRDLTDKWSATLNELGAPGLPVPEPVPAETTAILVASPFALAMSANRKPKNDLSPDDGDAFDRLRGSQALLAALRREFPERCAA